MPLGEARALGFVESLVVAEAEDGTWGHVRFTGPEGYEAARGARGCFSSVVVLFLGFALLFLRVLVWFWVFLVFWFWFFIFFLWRSRDIFVENQDVGLGIHDLETNTSGCR